MQNQRLPRGEKAWKKYWKEWEKLAKPHHEVTDEMAEEYYAYMEGNRRYLSYADKVTMGQLETLRALYENKKEMDQLHEATFCLQIEDDDPENCYPSKRRNIEEQWKQQQQIPNIEPKMFRPGKPPKVPSGPRQTKWTRVKRHGVLQLRLRELEKPTKYNNN